MDRLPLYINLGIDFGTSYTKVCYRDVATEESSILTFVRAQDRIPYLPSIVYVDRDGLLSTPIDNNGRSLKTERFLKMRIGDQNDKLYVQALSSYYCAKIVRYTMEEFKIQEQELAEGKQIIWSANIGVPVDYYDSAKLPLFREVFAIAWKWAVSDNVPMTYQEAMEQYKNEQREVNTNETDCHAVPEIVAAVFSFVTSHEARPGIYTYFDIGGGTLDGVCFRYENNEGARDIICYSSKVTPLGINSLMNLLRHPSNVNIERVLAAKTYHDQYYSVYQRLVPYYKLIQTLVGEIVMKARERILGGFEENTIPFFLGGGGARSEWYQRAIWSTYIARQHYNCRIPPYDLREVPRPQNLEMNNLTGDEIFPRYTVAYGLSVPAGEIPNDYLLPSQFSDIIIIPEIEEIEIPWK